MNVYVWWYRCSLQCSFWKTSSDPGGERSWATETCPYDKSALVEMTAESAR